MPAFVVSMYGWTILVAFLVGAGILAFNNTHTHVVSATLGPCAPPLGHLTTGGSSACINHPIFGTNAATQLKDFNTLNPQSQEAFVKHGQTCVRHGNEQPLCIK